MQHFQVGKGSRDKIYTNLQYDSSTSEELPMHCPGIAIALSHTVYIITSVIERNQLLIMGAIL